MRWNWRRVCRQRDVLFWLIGGCASTSVSSMNLWSHKVGTPVRLGVGASFGAFPDYSWLFFLVLFLSSCCCLVLVWSEQRPGVILALIAKWLWQQVSCRAHESSSSWRCHTPPQFASQMQRQTRRPSGENEARYTAITSMSPWGAFDVGALIAEESHLSVSSCQSSRKSVYAIYYAKQQRQSYISALIKSDLHMWLSRSGCHWV